MSNLNKRLDNFSAEAVSANKNLTVAYQEAWERRSSIRTRPFKLIDFTKAGYFFPESKQPLLLHPEIINMGENTKYEILLQSFKKYLVDIVTLEIKMIDSACRMLIEDDLPVYFDEQVKLNTNTVMIDEYYHVYIARSMLYQISQRFPKLKFFNYPKSDANHAVYKIKSSLDEKYRKMFHIIAVCIFETTLVRELIDFFNTDEIHPCIRHYVNDHMNDEAKHYGFFYDLLCYTWNSLPEDFKVAIGHCLGQFIQLYLNINSEKIFYEQLCANYIKDKDKTKIIINDLYKGFVISPDIPIVKNVMNVLKKTGITSHEATKSGFAKIGWDI